MLLDRRWRRLLTAPATDNRGGADGFPEASVPDLLAFRRCVPFYVLEEDGRVIRRS